ncbi:MAG: putative metal-binding motif-containing protein, partial [Myxococcales bacterium]|nr:putative metal-binding motif-containing protein [Myxococcales bacterium]
VLVRLVGACPPSMFAGKRDSVAGVRLLTSHHLLTAALALGGCAGQGAAGVGGAGTGGAPEGGGGGGGTGGDGGLTVGSGGGGGGGETCDPGLPSVDDDLDGFSEDQGDCNDCDPNANPDAIEVVFGNNPQDEDCDGLVDEPAESCDAGLAIDSLDAVEAARALGLCRDAGAGQSWGLVSAAYVDADGSPGTPSLNVGLLPKLGDYNVPKEGQTMVALSSGHARDTSQPDSCGGTSCSLKGTGTAPPGYPQPVPNCVTAPTIHDDVALEVALRAPSNAHGYRFEFAFFSWEFPRFVCTAFNDQFVVLTDPAPPQSLLGNIAFDNVGNPVSVNLGLLPNCYPEGAYDFASSCKLGPMPMLCPPPPNPYCPGGPGVLSGTGFDMLMEAGASTGWLTTTAPITPGDSVRLRFAIWDASDSQLDSTVILDRFEWLAEAATIETVPTPR